MPDLTTAPVAAPLLTTKQAQALLAQQGIPVSGTALRMWATEHQLGRQIGKRWFFERSRLEKFSRGEALAKTA